MNATAVRTAPAAHVEHDGAAGRRRAVLALARLEAVRLLRHPITVVAVLFLIGIWVSGWITNEANHYPVLQDADRETQLGMMLLLGGAALIAGNLAVLRTHRNGTTALSDVLVLPPPSRVAAHLLALLPLAAFAAALTGARIAVLTLAPAAGRANLLELVTGPVIVVLFGAVGVLLARLTRSPIAAPLALLAIFAMLIVLPLLSSGGPGRWLQPVVAEGDAAFVQPAPVYLMARPVGAHLVYLVGLTILAAVAALARSGGRTIRVMGLGGLALAVTIAGGIAQTRDPGALVSAARLDAANQPSHHQTCQRRDQITYCAFPDFVEWIDGWHAQVRGVLRSTPTVQAQQPYAVRQRITVLNADGGLPSPPVEAWQADDLAAGTPNAVTVGTRWGDSRSVYNFAGLFAYRVVTGDRPTGPTRVCGAQGVLVGWLAAQATDQAGTGLRLLAKNNNFDGGVLLTEVASDSGVVLPSREITMILSILDRPADEIGARVGQSWAELAEPQTSIERAAEILGVPAPAGSSTALLAPPGKARTQTSSERPGQC